MTHPGRRRLNERGSAVALVILMLPILIGVFGLGVDTARAVYVKQQLQGAADQAVTSAASVTIPGAQITIDPDEGARRARQVYAENRQYVAGLACLGPETAVPGTGGLKKCWDENQLTVSEDGDTIRLRTRERIDTFFLRVLGKDTQELNIEAAASIVRRQY